MNLSGTLPLHARTRASHPAIIAGERVITYGELDPQVGRTASHLKALGLGSGDLLGVCLGDHADHVTVLLAAARLGVAVLPMDWHWTPAERQRIVDVFQPKAVMIEADAAAIAGVPIHRRDVNWHDAVVGAIPQVDGPDDTDMPLVLALSSGTTALRKGR